MDVNTEARISYIIEMLRELFKLVDKDRFRMLAYMLSMAFIEAEDVYRNELTKRSKVENSAASALNDTEARPSF
ncbi:hypothetical protein [Phyllobacterium leguminum]|uniref:Uncharacterized protein n=1 Tax=Phyllobacterium leguminum TaxID=314237 RepID=A0A318T1V8_9HYPH|nr:hypothetical protein [Phyllobacterium leguminum]PYE84184.1 hypothetical protein C7477_1541 [Phyllobacterium leguminum]